ncbi:unnamed protein product [Alopecurus aequalis]
MASPKLVLLLVLAAAATSAAQEYCRDSLRGLLACNVFTFEGASVPPPACCDAYGAAFNDAPLCLCYIANGVASRSIGHDVNLTRALEIPTRCGQVQPPVEFCGTQGLELPLYEPEALPPSPASGKGRHRARATDATHPPPMANPTEKPPSAATHPPPTGIPTEEPPSAGTHPRPPPTSCGGHDSSLRMVIVLFFTITALVVTFIGASP